MQEAAKLALTEATLGKWVRQDLNHPPSCATAPKFGLDNPNNTFPFPATQTCTNSLSIKITSTNEPLDTDMEHLITLEKAALRNPVKNLCIHLNVHVREREKEKKTIFKSFEDLQSNFGFIKKNFSQQTWHFSLQVWHLLTTRWPWNTVKWGTDG